MQFYIKSLVVLSLILSAQVLSAASSNVATCPWYLKLLGFKQFPTDYHQKSQRLVNEGSSSEVYEIEYEGTKQKAIRKYLSNVGLEKGFAESDFKNEAEVYEYLRQHNFEFAPRFYGLWKNQSKNVFIEIEYLDAMSYAEWIARTPDTFVKAKLGLLESIQVLDRVASAVQDLNEVGVYHFDLKPDNVVVTSDKKIKLIDFAAAQINPSPSKTPFKFVEWASVDYAPPELPEKPHASADQYALAKMIEVDIVPAFRKAYQDNLEEFKKINEWELSLKKEVLDKATNPDPSKRYKSVREFQGALRRWTEKWFSANQ